MNKGRQKIVSFWIPMDEEKPKQPGVYNVTIEYQYWAQRPFFKDVYTATRSTVARWHPDSGWELLDYALCLNPNCTDTKVLAWTYLPGLYIPPHRDGEIK